jgi:hypothetical protein
VSFDWWKLAEWAARDEQPILPTSTNPCITRAAGTKGVNMLTQFVAPTTKEVPVSRAVMGAYQNTPFIPVDTSNWFNNLSLLHFTHQLVLGWIHPSVWCHRVSMALPERVKHLNIGLSDPHREFITCQTQISMK